MAQIGGAGSANDNDGNQASLVNWLGINAGETTSNTIGTATQTTFFGNGNNLEGLHLFDAIVDPGGDYHYTDLGSAIAGGAKSIYVRRGTYLETGANTITSDMIIVGENAYDTIIDVTGMTSGRMEFAASASNVIIHNIQFTQTASPSVGLLTTFGAFGGGNTLTNARITNCKFTGGPIGGGFINVLIEGNFFNSSVAGFYDCIRSNTGGAGCFEGSKILNNTFDGNYDHFVRLISPNSEFNTISNNRTKFTGAGASTAGILVAQPNNIITNNIIDGSDIGVRIDIADDTICRGNQISNCATGINISDSDRVIISDNNILSATSSDFVINVLCNDAILTGNVYGNSGGTGVNDSGTNTLIIDPGSEDSNVFGVQGNYSAKRTDQPLLIASDTIDPESEFITARATGAGPVTLTSTPSIAAGVDGQKLIIMGLNDANTVTIQDKGNLAGSGVSLDGGIDMTLAAGDILELIYSTTFGFWFERSRSDNDT